MKEEPWTCEVFREEDKRGGRSCGAERNQELVGGGGELLYLGDFNVYDNRKRRMSVSGTSTLVSSPVLQDLVDQTLECSISAPVSVCKTCGWEIKGLSKLDAQAYGLSHTASQQNPPHG